MPGFRFELALDSRFSVAPLPGFGMGDDIDLTDPRLYHEICLRGWDALESAGAWNRDETALLSIPLDQSPADPPVVWVEGDAFATDRHGQVVSVVCNGTRLRPVCLRPPTEKLLRILWPRDRLPDRRLTIALEFANLVSPSALGVAADGRGLGFMVRRIVVTAPAAPRPAWLSGDVVTIDDRDGVAERLAGISTR